MARKHAECAMRILRTCQYLPVAKTWRAPSHRNHYIACAWFSVSDTLEGPDTWVNVFGVKNVDAQLQSQCFHSLKLFCLFIVPCWF